MHLIEFKLQVDSSPKAHADNLIKTKQCIEDVNLLFSHRDDSSTLHLKCHEIWQDYRPLCGEKQEI